MYPFRRRFQRAEQLRQGRVGDWLAPDRHALSGGDEFRGHVSADPMPRGTQDTVEKHGNGALAVRPRDVQAGEPAFRVSDFVQ